MGRTKSYVARSRFANRGDPISYRSIQISNDPRHITESSWKAQDWPEVAPNIKHKVLFADGDPEHISHILGASSPIVEVDEPHLQNYMRSESNTWGGCQSFTNWDEHQSVITPHSTMFVGGFDLSLEINDVSEESDPYQGAWHFPRIYSSYKPIDTSILIMNLPSKAKNTLGIELKSKAERLWDPYAIFGIYYDYVLKVHFRKLSALNNNIEKNLGKRNLELDPVFVDLYVQLRNCQDFLEAIEADMDALDTLQQGQQDLITFLNNAGKSDSDCKAQDRPLMSADVSSQLNQEFKAYKTALKGFARRLKALERRVSNRIGLGFNQIAQRDSAASMQLARAATQDSAAMKVIAFTTVLILPATFVATIFGTNFFIPPKSKSSSTQTLVSDNFWVYWAISIPLTLCCGAAGALWHYNLSAASTTNSRINHLRFWKIRKTLDKDVEKVPPAARPEAFWKTGKPYRTYDDYETHGYN